MKKPTDATLRNVKAANKKIAKLVAEIKDLKRRVKMLERVMRKLLTTGR